MVPQGGRRAETVAEDTGEAWGLQRRTRFTRISTERSTEEGLSTAANQTTVERLAQEQTRQEVRI
jgi:hypothetical protein